MNYCDDITSILKIVKFVLNLLRWIIPVIIIVLTTLDVAKVVTAGNLDDKLKKEVGQKISTRLIYAVIIFLIPTIVSLLFGLLGTASSDVANGQTIECGTWSDLWKNA